MNSYKANATAGFRLFSNALTAAGISTKV